MGYYLLDRPTRRKNWYTTRRSIIRAFVIHCTAGLEDLDGVDDHSAEATARYAANTDRAASWHSGSDTDSHLPLLPDSYTAFHCKGYNSSTVGHEISKTHVNWAIMPRSWVLKTLRQAALSVAPRAVKLGIPFKKITKAEFDRGAKGFLSHGELDRDRRSDPGWVTRYVDTFPWDEFFAICREVVGGDKPEPPTPPKPPGPPAWQRLPELEFNMKTITRGTMNDRWVRKMQALLVAHGHNVEIDGDFGDGTTAALHRHMRAWGITPKNVVDEPVWRTLVEG